MANLSDVNDRCLSLVTFSAGDIGKIIQNLSSDKTHGHDSNITIRMLKICGDTINKPLELIFNQAPSSRYTGYLAHFPTPSRKNKKILA